MLIDLIGMIIASTLIIYSVCLLNDREMKHNDKRLWQAIIIYDLIVLINNELDFTYVRPIIRLVSLILILKFIIKYDFKKILVSIVYIYTIILFIEFVLSIGFSLSLDTTSSKGLMNSINNINEIGYITFLINTISTLILLFIIKSNKGYSVYKWVYKRISIIKKSKTFYTITYILLMILFSYIIIFYTSNIIASIIMFIILLIIMTYIFAKELIVRNEYEETKEKYNSTQQSLVEYEDMIDKYRVNNHENKNQLLTIQNMIKSKDKKVNEYIDNLVGNVYMTNEKIMMDVSIIPAGGLRATIHTKLNIMDDKKIKYILNIDRKIRMVDFDNISSELNLKICKIVSIFIDNAIDEVMTHKEDKVVNIEMYIENNKLVVEVSNSFINTFDVNKIFEKKYTTKSNGHGYGLSLAKELIDSEEKLNNLNRIDDDIFTQILEIKIKK
ncbi:MAG TPA: GHKL domain-containing protein [Bacilli bacterium]|nr:GHKL domain-containing protein [Bacilli bacterium]